MAITIKALTIVFFMALTFGAYAQTVKKNSVYVEALGNSIFYSVNYDRTFKISEQINLVPRFGFMYFPLTRFRSNRDYGNVSIPLELNLTWHKNPVAKNFPEIGFGLNLIGMIDNFSFDESGNKENISTRFARVTTLRAGFRHQKPQGGLMYRAGLLTPITQDKFSKSRVGDDIFYRLYVGFSIGYSF